MKRLIAIGEALIDFTPGRAGSPIKATESFMPHVGGAPANVCGAFAKLGGEAALLTQLGTDPFGDKIVEELASHGICVEYISRTEEANTSLAFVALQENGDREFSFYRKPGADMLYRPEQVPREIFEDGYALHFCSVSLGNYPMKEAHRQAIRYARDAGMLVSFDPNLRRQLWDSERALREAVLEFLPDTDILKLSEEEVEFVTGKTRMEDALEELFAKGISVALLTRGSEGASVYTARAQAHVPGNGVRAVDTTGAGDGFIGSFLNQLAWEEKTLEHMKQMTGEEWMRYLAFSDFFCGKSVRRRGAISSYVTRKEMEDYYENI